ncbi:Kinesin light chain 4 (KLC 4) (Kinesin-like protein 8) [Durusdinium trenchii]|uniref:Kinesin light chain 4 (KLC 4) (Kinesin-like protein 8) n=1 Tax=Durusdinium trenchii TaxID=1381693 RepID=A0ABP0KHT1_9DINO
MMRRSVVRRLSNIPRFSWMLGRSREQLQQARPAVSADALLEAAGDVVRWTPLSVAALRDLARDLADGREAQGLRLMTLCEDFVDDADPDAFVSAGTTVRVVKVRKNGTLVVALPRAAGRRLLLTVKESDVKPKSRQDWSTDDVCAFYVVAETLRSRAVFVDLLERAEVGEPFQGAFVIHPRLGKFQDLVHAIVSYYERLRTPLEQQFVWLDVLCANQVQLRSNGADLDTKEARQRRARLLKFDMHAAIARFNECLVFFESWGAPTALSRMWCIWEMLGAIEVSKAPSIIMPPGADQEGLLELVKSKSGRSDIAAGIGGIDFGQAFCASQDDRTVITGFAATLPRGIAGVNAKVTGHVRQHLKLALVKLGSEQHRAQGDSKNMSRLFYKIAQILEGETFLSDALHFYRESLRMRRSCGEHDETNPNLLTTRYHIAHVLQLQGDFDGALRVFKEVLAIEEDQFGETNLSVLKTKFQIGVVLHLKGEFELSRAYFEDVLAQREAQLGPDHKDCIAARYQLALVLTDKGDKRAALEHFRKVFNSSNGSLFGALDDQ